MSYKVFVLKDRLIISKIKIIERRVASKKWDFLAVLYCINNKDLRLCGANAPNFRVSCLLRLLCSLRCRSQNCVNNDAAIIAHICYISLIRCNYYHEYLACEEEDFCERYISVDGEWEVLWRALSYFVENCSVTA